MLVYEFFSIDKAGNEDFFAFLPERRKDSRRITKRSIMKWGRLGVCDPYREKTIYFIPKISPDPPRKKE